MAQAGVPPRLILTDIEGTTTPIAFVRDILFPHARAGLPALLRDHATRPDVAAELAAVPGPDPLATLLAWMDRDAKETPLKALQGILWREGYAAGAVTAPLYPDVAPAMRAWRQAGLRIAVYSSGSIEAQKLLFGHSDAGDLSALIEAYFDTKVGPKRDAASYRRIADALTLSPGDILFLSDIEAELDAAEEAGLQTTQLVRAADQTEASDRHRSVQSFKEAVLF